MYYDPSGYMACPTEQDGGDGGNGGNDDANEKSHEKLDDIIDIMKEGEKTKDGRNIISRLEDGAQIIFRMDTGENAHSIGNDYPNPVEHMNIEIHVPTPRGNNKPRLDIHIIVNDFKEVIAIIFTGEWTKKMKY